MPECAVAFGSQSEIHRHGRSVNPLPLALTKATALSAALTGSSAALGSVGPYRSSTRTCNLDDAYRDVIAQCSDHAIDRRWGDAGANDRRWAVVRRVQGKLQRTGGRRNGGGNHILYGRRNHVRHRQLSDRQVSGMDLIARALGAKANAATVQLATRSLGDVGQRGFVGRVANSKAANPLAAIMMCWRRWPDLSTLSRSALS